MLLKPLWKTFLEFYRIKINLIGNEIHMEGGEKLSPEKWKEINTWIDNYREHVITRLKTEGGYRPDK